jgi:hypothetical protein
MAEKKVKVKVDVETNAGGSISQLRELKKELKAAAAGSAEFNQISKNIKEVEDALEESRAGAKGFKDMLEEAPGPLGNLFKGLRQAEIATKGFGTALKATGIGLIVAAVGGLVAAFTQVEGATKKLEPLMIGLQKILGGIFRALEPLIDGFVQLAVAALPAVTKGVGIFYSAIVGLFTYIKEAGSGVAKVWKGIFTLDRKAVEEGINQVKNSFKAAADAGIEAYGRFEMGTQELTKTEKENAEERQKIADEERKKREEAAAKALAERKKMMDAQDKLDMAALEKLKAEALALATTEQEKFDIEKQFADKVYELRLKDLQDKLALEKKGSAEAKQIEADIIALQTERITKQAEFAEKSKQITEKAEEDRKKLNQESLVKEELALQLRFAKGEIAETEFQESLFKIRKQYANSNEDLVKAEIDITKFRNEEKKKLASEERNIELNRIQTQLDALDRANNLSQLDFEQDLLRFAQQRELLAEQERVELQNEELTEFQKTEIRKKYSDARRAISDQEIQTEMAAMEAKHEINMAYLGLFEQFGNVLSQIAGKNKALAIAGIIIQQASSIGQIIANTGIANAKAVAASPLTLGQPWVAINTISAGLSIAASIAGAVKSIQQINQAAAQGGVKGGAGGSVGAAPQVAPPRVGGVASPQIQTQGGANPTTQIAETIAGARAPLRAYVVSGEVSSQQALDRRTSRAATFTGG